MELQSPHGTGSQFSSNINSTVRFDTPLLDLVTDCQNDITFYVVENGSKKCFKLFLYKLLAIMEILAALKIPYEATIHLQNASSSLTDFFGIFRQKAPNQITDFATAALSNIESKRPILLKNGATSHDMCDLFTLIGASASKYHQMRNK